MPLQKFRELYGPGEAFVASAPGRVNLIGEHTDYNGGYVLPIAIDRRIRIAFRPTGGKVVDIHSADFGERESFDLRNLAKRDGHAWVNYPMGVAHVLQEAGHEVRGFAGAVEGDVPVGAGLSSSAAFEVASILAFAHSSGLSLEKREMALLCQRAEHLYAGVRCGLMDMYVSLFAEKNRAVLLDCTSNEHELEPLDGSQAAVVVCDTGVKHELAQSAYNERRAECEAASAKLRARLPEAKTYRDVSVADFERHSDALGGKELARARHVVRENRRVLDAVAALRAGDLDGFGAAMYASHESLRDDYEVSCPELDALVELARGVEGVFGSRMTGGGFGGCTVSLVRHEALECFRRTVEQGYERAFGRKPAIHVFEPAEGARVESAAAK